MSVTDFERRPAGLSVSFAALLVVGVGVAVAGQFGIGPALSTVVGFLGVGVVVWSARTVTLDPGETDHRQRLLASVVLTCGSVLVLAPAFALTPAQAVVVAPFLLSALFVGVASAGGMATDTAHHFSALCWRCRDVTAVLMVLTVGLATGLFWAGGVAVVEVGRAVVTTSSLGSLLALQALVFLLVLTLPRAQEVLDSRLGTPAADAVTTVSVAGARIDEVLPQVRRRMTDLWWVGVLQMAAFVAVPQVLDRVLSAVPVFGPGTALLLASGVLHLLVALVVLLAVVTIALGHAHAALVSWTRVDPPRLLASVAGGAVVAFPIAALTLLAPTFVTETLLPQSLHSTAAVYGPGLLLLGPLVVLLLAVPLVLAGLSLVGEVPRLATGRTSGFLVASALALFGTILAALQSAHALVVFAGVAVAILVWDLGEQASYLGTRLGVGAATRETQVVHAAASIAVGVAGIGLAAVMAYLVGPLSLPAGSGRAGLGVALALLATLSFTLVLARE